MSEPVTIHWRSGDFTEVAVIEKGSAEATQRADNCAPLTPAESESIARWRTAYERGEPRPPVVREDKRQRLQIEVQDGGGGPFVVLSTERFALDDPNDLLTILETARRMLAKYREDDPMGYGDDWPDTD